MLVCSSRCQTKASIGVTSLLLYCDDLFLPVCCLWCSFSFQRSCSCPGEPCCSGLPNTGQSGTTCRSTDTLLASFHWSMDPFWAFSRFSWTSNQIKLFSRNFYFFPSIFWMNLAPHIRYSFRESNQQLSLNVDMACHR
jgi:hypothetical protein